MEKNYVLEITLISAQGLTEPSGKLHRMKTYALAWIDSSVKLRTCIDRDGQENPTWNDKFLFKISSDFLSRETSGVSVEIFAVGFLRDTLLGTVRLLVSNFLRSGSAFNAVMIRRPSDRFQGVLNFGAAVFDSANVPALNGVSAIGFRDLIGEKVHPKTPRKQKKKSKSKLPIHHENLFRDSDDKSDVSDSTSSSSSTASTALGEWDGIIREVKTTNHVRSSSEGGRMISELQSPSKADSLSPFIFRQRLSFSDGKLANGRSRFAS